MFDLYTRPPTAKYVKASFETYEAAESYAFEAFKIICFYKDDDVDCDAADFITAQGEIYSIEPRR